MLGPLAGRILTAILLLMPLSPAAALAGGALPQATGRVILSVSGKINLTNADGRADFDRALLGTLPRATLTTWTPWTDGEVTFEGVLGATLLDAVGAEGATVRAIALNDYAAEMPLSDFRNYRVLLATHMAGERLPVRDKGPLWIVFPWTDHPELQDEATRYKSVWQLRELVIQ
jgi:hypothetical protein